MLYQRARGGLRSPWATSPPPTDEETDPQRWAAGGKTESRQFQCVLFPQSWRYYPQDCDNMTTTKTVNSEWLTYFPRTGHLVIKSTLGDENDYHPHLTCEETEGQWDSVAPRAVWRWSPHSPSQHSNSPLRAIQHATDLRISTWDSLRAKGAAVTFNK